MSTPLWVIIPSAGKGKRFGSSVPKQYQPLLNTTVLQNTLNRFTSRSDVCGIVLAVASDDEYIKSLPSHPLVHIVQGGKERSDSVLNALNYLHNLVAENTLIAVHDAARPCIRKSSLDRLFEVARSAEAGAIMALAATDTVKLVDMQKIKKTIDRNQIWLAQTPQVFPFKMISTALKMARAKGMLVTDEASAIELMGLSPIVVSGRQDNIKITNTEDLALATFLLTHILEEQD